MLTTSQRQFDFTNPTPARTPVIVDGSTFDRKQDAKRLTSLHHRVLEYMLSHGEYRTLAQIRGACGGSENGIAARLRAYRLPQHGGYRMDCERDKGGLYRYRVRR